MDGMEELEIDDPLTIFRDALPNSLTRDRYEKRLDQFFKFLALEGKTLEQKSQNFAEKSRKNPTWLATSVLRYMRYQKERVEKQEISAATISNYYKPIKLFCEMNDIIVNWKKITRGIPKGKRFGTDRIPTLDEIKRILQYPDRRIKTAILIMLSSGIRLGAWDYLRCGDIVPIKKDDQVLAAKIIVYRGEPEEYVSFITPEAYGALQEYLNFRITHREKITDKSWVLRDEFDTGKSSRGIATIPKQLKSAGLKRLIERALWAQGIRTPLEKGQKRHEFKTDHGFRKYFKTIAEKHMKSLHVEMLMGHSTGLANNYYKISDDELLSEYLKSTGSLSVYILPQEFESEQIKNVYDELMRVKFDVVGLLEILSKNGLISNSDLKNKFTSLKHHFELENEGYIVKNTGGKNILF